MPGQGDATTRRRWVDRVRQHRAPSIRRCARADPTADETLQGLGSSPALPLGNHLDRQPTGGTAMSRANRPTVCVIVPVMNEVQTIAPLAEQLLAVAAESDEFELAGLHFVDDGSNDGTWESIVAVANTDPRVHGIRLRRNFGKASALQLGVGETDADIIVTMDGDLQDDPRELPRFIA